MLERFNQYREENSLGRPEDKILLAVSGGIDSVVMTQLYQEAGSMYAMAHCNFQLRGEESEEDEQFVRDLADKYDCRLFTTRFSTKEYCRKNKLSVQMGARDLRYSWFNELARKEGYHYIAIAHNKNDVAETMLINLIRGTGLKGLTGIKPRTDTLIRPLLFASRDEIMEYAQQKELAYREDSSNRENKYHRNLIRNEIIPLMQQINPSLLDTLFHEKEVFSATFRLYREKIDRLHQSLTTVEGNTVKMSISKIRSLRLEPPIIYELLSPWGYTFSDATDIYRSLAGEPGRRFHSDKYVLIRDRNFLIIEPIKEETGKKTYRIGENETSVTTPVNLSLKKAARNAEFRIPDSKTSIVLDYDKLRFPLRLRHWQNGDFFIPLGMKGRKKLSDFFTDQKLSLLDKEKVWLLLSGRDIVWVVGMQIDDRFKITSSTRNILSISIND